MADKTIRVITHDADGSILTMEYQSFEKLDQTHEKIGIDDSSTDLSLRGMPVYRGLIGPIPENKTTVRYESPEVFEIMTKEWMAKKVKRRRRRSTAVPAPLAIDSPPTMTSMPSEVL